MSASDWTLDTLRVHLEAVGAERQALYLEKFTASEKAVSAALASAKEAVAKAEISSDKRFEGVNEMRKMAEDNLRITMPRLEQEAVNAQNRDKMAGFEKRLDQMSGQKAGGANMFVYVVAGLSLVVAAVETVVLILRK